MPLNAEEIEEKKDVSDDDDRSGSKLFPKHSFVHCNVRRPFGVEVTATAFSSV